MGIRESIELAIDQRRQKAEIEASAKRIATGKKVRRLQEEGKISPELAEKWTERAKATYEGGGSLAPLGGKIVGMAKGFQQGLGNMGRHMMEEPGLSEPAVDLSILQGGGGGRMPSFEGYGNPWAPERERAPRRRRHKKTTRGR